MGKSLLYLALFFITTLPPVDDYLDRTMVGKVLIQTFGQIILGMLFGRELKAFSLKDDSQRISGIIIFTFLFIFWSIPRSVDLSEIYPWLDQLYHLSMFVGGLILYKSLTGLNRIVKGAYGLLFSSMLVATALVYKWKNTLLCSTYTLEDQYTYSRYLLVFGIAIYISVVLWIVFKWGKRR